MQVIIGIALLFVSVIGSYIALGGKLILLFQPFELTLIFGSGIAAFIIGNTRLVSKRAFSAMKQIFRGSRYKHDDYLDLILLLYQVFRNLKTKGPLSIEKHVEEPEESDLFNEYPSVMRDEVAFSLIIDYLRLIVMGTNNPYEIETLIEEEVEIEHKENTEVVHALTVLGESFPALGIVAAVLGVIKAMSAITEPPEILGGLIAAALVGTFLGILLSYGLFSPFASIVKQIKEEEETYLHCIKAGMLAHLRGYAPVISIEFARKSLQSHNRPSFEQLEEMINELPPLK
jgi:chemotaxis protein MotA